MTKLLTSLGLALAAAITMTGCELYFGHDDGPGGRPGGGGGGGGWTCVADADCAAGCFCAKDDSAASGVCEEAGFCSEDADCPDGYTCDDRSSCVPDPVTTCETEADCAAGSICTDGLCEPSCVCSSDAEAQAAGWGYCDEARNTCMPPLAGGSCGGELTCTNNPPSCAPGEVPVILDGCYQGECSSIALCDVTPTCEARQHESDCLGVAGCGAVYNGINCTNADGTACQAGDAGCTCESFSFDECRSQTTDRTVVDSLGRHVDLGSTFAQ